MQNIRTWRNQIYQYNKAIQKMIDFDDVTGETVK